MTRITTKKGDKGYTCCWSKEIISKHDIVIETLGKLDELMAYIGIVRVKVGKIEVKAQLKKIQDMVSKICAEIIGIKPEDKQAIQSYIQELENYNRVVDEYIKYPTHWWFCGNKESATLLNYARTLARKCERQIVFALNEKKISNEQLIVFFNRLSDTLYLMILEEEQYKNGDFRKNA